MSCDSPLSKNENKTKQNPYKIRKNKIKWKLLVSKVSHNNVTKDLVENSDGSLESDLEVGVLLLTSLKLSGEDSENKLSIPVQFVENTVGNWKSCWECVLEENENSLFSKSLIGTTI